MIKKIFIFIVFIFLLIFSYNYYISKKFQNKVMILVGIKDIKNIEVLEKGITKDFSTKYIVFSLKDKSKIDKMKYNYQKNFPVHINKIELNSNVKTYKFLKKYIDFNEVYYSKVLSATDIFNEIYIQNNIIIYMESDLKTVPFY